MPANRLQNGQTMHAGIEVDDGNIDIVHVCRQNLECLPRAAHFAQTMPALFRHCFHDRVRIGVAVRYQENLSFHTLMKPQSLTRGSSIIVIIGAKIGAQQQ